MGTPGPAPDVTADDALSVFLQSQQPWTPLTATDVADELQCSRRTARRKLEDLAERGEIRSKTIDSDRRVWWRPPTGCQSTDDTSPDGESTPRLATDPSEIVDRMAGVFTALDTDWRITYLNERSRRAIVAPLDEDLSKEDLIGRRLWDVNPATTEAEVQATELYRSCHEAMERQEKVSYERYIDDEDIWVYTRVYPSDSGVSIFSQDITERKERERTLERRARQQRAVADLGQFALETDDLGDLLSEASRRVADVLDTDYAGVFEFDPDERALLVRQGTGWQDGTVGTATIDADATAPVSDALDAADPVVVGDGERETRVSGSGVLASHDVTSGVTTIIGSVDEPWGLFGTYDTERREFTAEDVTFVRSVANVLAEAIHRHRYQAELADLVDRLEESNERLEQFAYAVSHDLQEPLRMVSSYLQLLEARYWNDLDEDGEEFLDFALDGTDRMKAMIDGLLTYARIETRGDPFEPVDLDGVLDDVRADLQVTIEETDADITTESLPCVEGDASQLRQVFQNLLSNALEYSGDEPPRVHVSAERDGTEWIVSVSDEGIGIDPADAEGVFEVFTRLHSQTEHAGTGIGLSICKRIVERHGGEIWVNDESEPGEGTTVSFSLPAADRER